MRTEKELFDNHGQFLGWTPEELTKLREQFVRARFAERQVFGNEDIERWLKEQREATTPAEEWERFIARYADKVGSDFVPAGTNLTLLEVLAYAGATWTPERDTPFPRELKKLQPLGWFVALLELSIADLCVSLWKMPAGVIFLKGDMSSVLVFEPSEFSGCGTWGMKLLASHVASSLLMSWRCVGSASRGLRARRHLCTWFGERIVNVRAKAEADFDRAVAISPDGRIVHADEVWVVTPTGGIRTETVSIYPASTFYERKILLTPEYHTLGRFWGTREQYLASLAKYQPKFNEPFLMPIEDKKILFASKCFVPLPM